MNSTLALLSLHVEDCKHFDATLKHGSWIQGLSPALRLSTVTNASHVKEGLAPFKSCLDAGTPPHTHSVAQHPSSPSEAKGFTEARYDGGPTRQALLPAARFTEHLLCARHCFMSWGFRDLGS